jgi:hypothetical protein
MNTRRIVKPYLLAGTALVLASFPAHAASKFKAEYYPACYAHVSEARAMVEKPPVDVAGTAQKAGEVAGALGKLGGLPGLGGLGGLGGLASKASQVATYSNYLGDATKFTKKMQDDYPDAATRVAAYGDKMGGDADKIGSAGMKLHEARGCYDKSFAELKAGVASGEINAKDAAKRQKEIQAGVDLATEVLDDARTTMDTNIKSYNEALTTDTSGMGLNLGSIAQAASLGTAAVQMSGSAPGSAGMYNAYYTQTNAYTSAWWDSYNKTGDQAAANAAAQATLGGVKSPVQPYQEAYWQAQAAAAAKGTALSAVPASSIANLGTLQSLSSLGGFGGLSGTGLAWVAANQAVGAVSSATSGQDAAAAAPSAAVTTGANLGQTLGQVNALRGLSGGGAAFVGANLAAGALGNAISGQNAPQEAAAPVAQDVSDAMKGSLLKTSVDSSKFTDAYGLVSLQTQEYAALSAAVKAPLQ